MNSLFFVLFFVLLVTPSILIGVFFIFAFLYILYNIFKYMIGDEIMDNETNQNEET